MWDILTKVHGARKFSSLGAGFKYNVVKVDVSYLFSASKVKKSIRKYITFFATILNS
jgi:hypothetical protein